MSADSPSAEGRAPTVLTPNDTDSEGISASSNSPKMLGQPEGREASRGFALVAICGMACRLPGGIRSPQEMWNFLLAREDARSRVPESRYNVDAFYSLADKPGTVKTQFGYFLDDDLSKADGSAFTMSPMELERCDDPQQRLMLEVARECVEDAGEADWKGSRTGVFVGNFGEDWSEMLDKEPLQYGVYSLAGSGDFALANRVSYEMNLQGPSITIRTACSSSLVALNEACLAIAGGDCESAIVGGASLILTPTMTIKLSEQGVLSPDASCKTFSADANGYGRAEAINAIYIKPLVDALRDGNPVRAVIRATATNSDGKTPGMTYPSAESQEALIRHAYTIAGITDCSNTPFVELHGTGTVIGDRIETNAVARVFGSAGTYIGSVKPNLGHSEGASGLTSVIKAVLALENRIIPPNIKFNSPNPAIPFESARLTVPVEPTPWPDSCAERISVNSFGIAGSNAHVILDSASSHNASRESEEASDHPQLLMLENYGAYLSERPENVEDVAYTLARRRQHLPYRSFVVASREQPGTPSPNSKTDESPHVVMVFTGQGAQWPQMGRDLFRSNSVFRDSIKGLDKHLRNLGDNGPAWTIEAELHKSAKTSKINSAELSQPLCTAVQIAVVDSLAAVGIVPEAVVGHSSGEIAGAYASGALTTEEAIIAAFHRGAIASKQTRPGAMAAIGMGWEDVKPFLVPNVGVACENSPNSVTLSGDGDKVSAVVADIQKAHPDVLARILKVDKAYHSHHMTEVGQEYYSLVGSKVIGRAPAKLFFSSVTGTLLPEMTVLGAQYWQENLESPVLFRDAISSVCRHAIGRRAVFVEIGPHAALAGPVRQTLTENGNTSPYVATMRRGQNCTETLLSAVGELYTMRASIDFAAMFPTGTCLPELPRYPWKYERSYWHESRMTKEWRQRLHSQHDLLGIKSTECTDFEPVWRNMFHLDNAPWVRDHKVNDDVVFPFAGYVAMAGEAVRQVTGVESGFEVRNMSATTALVLNEGKPVEIVTTLHRRNSAVGLWWGFTIGSHNGHVWTKHCTGEVRDKSESLGTAGKTAELARKIGSRQWYDVLRRGGLEFGPRFQCMDNIRSSTKCPGQSTAHIRNGNHGDEDMYHIHPVVIDASLQLLVCAAAYGLGRKHRNNVATAVDELSITRCSSDLIASATADFTYKGSVRGGGHCISVNGHVVLRMSGVRHTVLESPESGDTHAAAHQVWKPHVDFLEPTELVKPFIEKALYLPTLNELTQLCMLRSWMSISDIQPSLPHLQNYQLWLGESIESMDILSPAWKQLDEEQLLARIDARVRYLSGTPARPAAAGISIISGSLRTIMSGKTDVVDLLREESVWTDMHSFIEDFDTSSLLDALAHSRTNLRVLELGAGTGARTSKILAHLSSSYSKYTVTDTSSSLISMARERLKDAPRLEYMTLDISQELDEHGVGDQRYDLIIAVNVLHKTVSLATSLANIRKLLGPEGKLLLQEISPSTKWINYVMGSLPDWWIGAADSRLSEPYVNVDRWKRELEQAGFDHSAAIIADSDRPFQLTSLIFAQPMPAAINTKLVTLLSTDLTSDLGPILQELEKRQYIISRCTLHDPPPVGQDVISLLDQAGFFFEGLTSQSFDLLKRFLGQLGRSGLFWVTPLSSIHCQDPRYAQTQGFARTMRSEMNIDFAVCETEMGFGDSKILDVFERFQHRIEDDRCKPDMEYAIYNNTVNIPRFHPFTLAESLLTTDRDDVISLSTSRPGRLTDLYWSYQPPTSLARDMVEIHVYSAGLGFNDPLIATGNRDIHMPIFGQEASGVVSRVGSDVKYLQVGDRVTGLVAGALSSVVQGPESLFVKIPDNLAYHDAATLPLAYSTALYSLTHVGRLQSDQTILVHRGCSDIGIAAIQLGKIIGAGIYATVGSEDQFSYLVETFGLRREHVFLESDDQLLDKISNLTNSRGVDLVISPRSGEFLHASWPIVADFGRLIVAEQDTTLDRRNMSTDGLTLNRNYSYVDMDHLKAARPAVVGRLLNQILEFYEKALIQPVRPFKVFDAPSVVDAFKHIQDERHTGKTIVQLRRPSDHSFLALNIARNRKETPQFDIHASYMLVGGLGGLGRLVATWMVEHGARHLIFLSRNAGNGAEDQAFVHELATMGCEAVLVKGSVSDAEAVERAIHASSSTAPLKGILQMSMVLRDEGYPKMSWEDWEEAVAPKVRGTWNLHRATVAAGITLDFFVLLSSISGLIGQPGQANYASANSFLDAFRDYRAGLGLPATVVQLGPVDDVGVFFGNDDILRQLKTAGFYCIRGKEVLDALVLATATPEASSALSDRPRPPSFAVGLRSTTSLDSESNRLVWRKDPRMAIYQNLSGGSSTSNAAGDNGATSVAQNGLKVLLAAVRDDPNRLREPETIGLLAREIGGKVMALLLKPQSEVNTSLGLADLGIDSLVAIEMRSWWRQTFHFDISVLEMLGMGTLEVLANHAAEGLQKVFTE